MAGTVDIRWNQAGLNETLNSRGGTVGKFMLKEAVEITNAAKRKVSGPPHGTWGGKHYPSSPGGPPGVRTGAGRQSIMWKPSSGASVDIGVGRGYMLILEWRGHAPYPWLEPTLAERGYTVRRQGM